MTERKRQASQANTGRLYALNVGGGQRWDVLISDNAEQSRDMTWVRKHAPN